ncbi:transcription factor SRM1-like [Impatiens glandulifera]|uniref:transcription factor SRM1-like n=1 Tax=Impatiens glandulifera TaxID=253017 RepID=UPI001FB11D40|nr:transcription factor SRM1-like [Impatiens glandulifera]
MSTSGQAFSSWSREDNKAFEKALAMYSEDRDNRWGKIALKIPGKTMYEIKRHYDLLVDDLRRINSGFVPTPNYDLMGYVERPIPSWANRAHQNSLPWTPNEHRLFLLGLENCLKDDWQSISRNFVITKSSSQVASYAQKYFFSENSNNKERNRLRIDDVTVNSRVGAASRPHNFESNFTDGWNHKEPSSSSSSSSSSKPLV